MSNNAQKTHYARTLNRFTEGKIANALQKLGKSLPCHVKVVTGSIVTVSFDVQSTITFPDVTCPVFGPEYIRYPIQVGDKGVVISADYYIGGVTGLGGGTADLTQVANLSALIFLPVANKDWTPTEDPNKLVLYGPNGAVLRTVDKSSSITVDKAGGISIVSSVGVLIQAPSIQSKKP